MSFWLKPRQIVVMDAQSSGPARNFKMRYLTLLITFVVLILGSFVVGALYSPYHDARKVIPENVQLKREVIEVQYKLADAQTLNDLKDEQLSSLKEQLSLQEAEIVNISKQLHMYKSILDERKGTGIHILESQATIENKQVMWKSLFVKGGSYPRYLKGSYKVFAMGNEGQKVDLSQDLMRYKIESHIFIQHAFAWSHAWQPSKLELVIYNYQKKEVLRKIIPIKG